MAINEKKLYQFLGIDIGGTSIKYGWGNIAEGLKHFSIFKQKDNSLETLSDAVSQIHDEANRLIGSDALKGIGIGTPGMLDLKSGKIVGINPNLPGLTDLNPLSLINESYKGFKTADNDANLMALSQAYLFPEYSHVLGVTIGSGIGCGLVVNKEIYHGAHGYASELGHVSVENNGARCNCGKSGCLEAYSSLAGMLNRIKEFDNNFIMTDLGSIIKCASYDIKIACIVKDSIEYLSISLANLITLLDADVLVIGGGASEIESYPFAELRMKILDKLSSIYRNKIYIMKAVNGNQAGVLGAVILAETAFCHKSGIEIAY